MYAAPSGKVFLSTLGKSLGKSLVVPADQVLLFSTMHYEWIPLMCMMLPNLIKYTLVNGHTLYGLRYVKGAAHMCTKQIHSKCSLVPRPPVFIFSLCSV